MGWSLGYDDTHKRDIGYGVPTVCDHPDCNEEIDRGLGYVCGGDVYGGEHGCGLFFCGEHRFYAGKRRDYRPVCRRCYQGRPAFNPKPDVAEWIKHKLTDKSWAKWRAENPHDVALMQAALTKAGE